MESINENLEIMKCSSCSVSRDKAEFEKCYPRTYFKTCRKCRETKKRSRAKKADLIQNQMMEPILTIDDYLTDEWANMTAELLETMTFEEKCEIPICMHTKVSRLNILFIGQKIHKYCEGDTRLPFEERGEVPVCTVLDTETIEVHLPDRGGHFTVKHGDTWADIRENIHCC